MKKHFISIILLLLFLAVAVSAHARLTLGVVVSPAGEPSLMQRGQLESLVEKLHVELQEEVVIKEMPDSATVVNWLDQYAALDMALLSQDEIKDHPGRFLYVGQIDKDGQINLVARQGSSIALTEKAAEFVAGAGFSPWRRLDTEEREIDEPVAEKPPLSIDEVIAAKSKVSQAEALPKEKLVLAVIPELKGVIQTAAEAEQLADYLESVLPVEVQVKEFAQLNQFAEWFMRYRMVDLAVVTRDVAETNLGRDYITIVAIDPLDIDAALPEFLVGRRGHKPSLQDTLKQALLETQQSREGKELLATLGAQSFKEIEATQEDVVAQRQVADELPAVEIKQTPAIETPSVEEEQVVEFPEPVEPLPPAALVLPTVPERPMVAMQDVPPEPAIPDILPATPTVLAAPAVPDVLSEPEDVYLPEAPGAADIPSRVAIPELPASPDVVKSPVIPPEVALPDSPAETLLKKVEPPVLMEEGIAELTMPVAPVRVAAPEEPQAVTPPAVIAAPVLPVPPEAESLPEAPEVPSEVALPDSPAEPLLKTVEPPVVIEKDTAELTMPVEPAKVAAPEEPQVVTLPAVTSAPALPAPPEEVSFPEVLEPTDAPDQVEESKIIEEVLEFAEPVSSQQASRIRPVVMTDEDLKDEDVIALLGEETVAALVAQPEIPQELRPPGIPVVRPGLVAKEEPAIDEGLFLTSLPEPIEQKKTEPLPKLLPDPEQDQGVLYIVPFVAIMVPKEVNNRIFDQFVDALLNESENLEMEFVILKDGLKGIDPRWLSARKYVTGEIYGYIEETGSDVIDLRAKAKLSYHTPNQEAPAFSYLHPVSKFLDRDTAVIEEERVKLADNIAETLITEFLGVLKN